MFVKCKGSEIDFIVNSLIYEIPNSMNSLCVLEKSTSLFFFFFVNSLIFCLWVLLKTEILLHNITAKGSGGGGDFCLNIYDYYKFVKAEK